MQRLLYFCSFAVSVHNLHCLLFYLGWQIVSVNFELEPGAVGNTADFREANKRLEWGLKKVDLICSFPLVN